MVSQVELSEQLAAPVKWKRVEGHYQAQGACAGLWLLRDPEILLAGPRGTGKSRSVGELAKFWLGHQEWPGVRGLVLRKTRVSMNETFLKTWEQDVLGPEWRRELERVSRRAREKYVFPKDNGPPSELVVAGMDQQRLIGSDYDFIIVEEAVQFSEREWADLTPLLRNHRLPWQTIIGVTNPASTGHWLYKRAKAGIMRWVESHFSDNPSITQDYINRLKTLPGNLRARWYEGRWVGADGLVYPMWSQDTHVRKRESMPPMRGYFGSMDFGSTAAGVLQVWGVDDNKRIWLVAEWYRTNKDYDWWSLRLNEADEEFELRTVVCDPSGKGTIEFLNKHSRRRMGRPLCVKANNDWDAGSRQMAYMLQTEHGGPAMLVVEGYERGGLDEFLDEKKLPTSFVTEIEELVHDEYDPDKPLEEKPARWCQDHACDSARYAAAYAFTAIFKGSAVEKLREKELGRESIELMRLVGKKAFWQYVEGVPGGQLGKRVGVG